MTTMIKVLPTAEAHVGLVHPVDGPLAAEGSVWTHDVFTERRIQEQVIRRFEADADAAPVEAKTVAKAKPQAAA
ncbi:hypothetical protein ABIE45_003892 [Methylobacterium sp. OAE515]|uniref:hypothetical protein n=1 Tax=Methylobacterium sp. OAE515 TaxID=2817895 RepID=UPI00178AFCE8